MSEFEYELATDIISRNNQDGTVVIMKMDDSNTFFKIDGVSAEVWTGISNKNSMETIINDILNRYEVSKEILNKDIESAINTLLHKNLIKKT